MSIQVRFMIKCYLEVLFSQSYEVHDRSLRLCDSIVNVDRRTSPEPFVWVTTCFNPSTNCMILAKEPTIWTRSKWIRR
jgi:hypothetical protein